MDSLRFTNNLLKVFWPIVDTTNKLHHGIDKFLTNILNPQTQNENTVKDLFEAGNMIHKIPTELFNRTIYHVIIKSHGLNHFATKQRKFIYQAKSLFFKLTR